MANEFVVRKGLIVTGSARITGSLEASSYVSASAFSGSFFGDGSGLSNVTTDVASVATVAETFTAQTSFTVTHNLNTANPIVQVYDGNDEQIIPQTIKIDNSQQVTITFPTATSGKVVIAKGGHLFTDDPALQFSEAFTSQSSITVTHLLGTITPIVQVYNSDNEQVIPQTIKALTSESIQVTFPVTSSGTITIAKGGHRIDAANLSYTTQTFTNTTLVSVTHSFGTTAPIVQVYNDSGLQVIPEEVRIINSNSLEVEFPITTSGTVAVSRGGHIITGPVFSGSFIGTFDGEITSASFATTAATASLLLGSVESASYATTAANLLGSIESASYAQTASYALNAGAGAGFPYSGSADITGSLTITSGDLNTEVVSASGHIVPTTTNTYDLGSINKQWRDIYVSSGSLYINGQQVLSTTGDELRITTSDNESIRIIETGNDTITLSTVDGDITLTSNGTGNIELDAPVQIAAGNKVLSSDGNAIVFGDDITVSGSINVTGNVDGVNVSQFKSNIENFTSSIDTTIKNKLNTDDVFSGSFNDISSNPFTSASGVISASGDLVPTVNESYDLGSPTLRWKDLYLSGSTVYLGETKLTRNATGDLEVRDSQTDSLKKIRVDELEIGAGETARRIKVENGSIKFVDENDTDKTLNALGFDGLVTSSAQLSFDEIPGIPGGLVSASSQVNLTEVTNFVSGIKARLNVEGVFTGSAQLIERGFIRTNYTASTNARLDVIESATSSLDTRVGLLESATSSLDSRLDSVESTTSSLDTRVTDLESYSSSLNTAISLSGADVTLLGNLTVQGTQSIINSQTLVVEDNIIELNGSGATFGGILVSDVTLPDTISGSLLWDSNNNYWIAGQSGSEERVLLTTDKTQLQGLIDNLEVASASLNSFTSSIDTTIKTKLNTDGVISGSSQVNYSEITGVSSGIVSASSQVDANSVTNFNSAVKGKLNTDGVISSSVQIDHDATTNYSADEHFTQANITTVGTVTSGNVNAILPSGVVSASSQVNHDSTTGFVANEHIDHSAVSITAGNGLTGGGDITTSRTINVGAGTGIDVAADAISVDVSDFMTNGSNNRVLTATGTDAMNAEANLTFDGSTLAVTGDLNVGSGDFFVDDSVGVVAIGTSTPNGSIGKLEMGVDGAGNGIAFYNGTGTSFRIWRDSDVAHLSRGSNSAIAIDSSRNVGIGTTSPSVKLDVDGDLQGSTIKVTDNIVAGEAIPFHASYSSADGNAPALRLGAGTSGPGFWDFQPTGTNSGDLAIEKNDTERLRITSAGNILPGANGTQDLGSSSLRWNTVYTSDLSLKNDFGDWTIVEGEDDLFLYNNKRNKVYKFALTEVDPETAPPKRS